LRNPDNPSTDNQGSTVIDRITDEEADRLTAKLTKTTTALLVQNTEQN